MSIELSAGSVVWAHLDPVKGREQGGHRPFLLLSSKLFHVTVTELVIGLPITTTDRGWPNNVAIRGPSGLIKPSWAMTEQIRAISRDRVTGVAGRVSVETLEEVRQWLADFLDFPIS